MIFVYPSALNLPNVITLRKKNPLQWTKLSHWLKVLKKNDYILDNTDVATTNKKQKSLKWKPKQEMTSSSHRQINTGILPSTSVINRPSSSAGDTSSDCENFQSKIIKKLKQESIVFMSYCALF